MPWIVYAMICELGISRSLVPAAMEAGVPLGHEAFLLLLTEWDSLQPNKLEVLCGAL